MDLVDITPEQAEQYIRASPAIWLSSCGRVIDKENQLRQPVLNIFQLRMSAIYEYCMATNRPCRMVCLKPRRIGGTTMGAAIEYHAMRSRSTNGVCIADTFRKSDNLFKMHQVFAEQDRFPWGNSFSFTQKVGSFTNRSALEKFSAEAPAGTRGLTLQAYHISETAFWADTGKASADETAASIASAITPAPGTVGIDESTPKGRRGYFFNEWQRARWPDFDGPPSLTSYWKLYSVQNNDKNASNVFRVFCAWYEIPEYCAGSHQRIPELQACTDREADDILDTLTEHERNIMDLYGLTENHIKWRRWCVIENCLGDENRFKEEYAEDPDSTFLASGSPIFSSEGLKAIELQTRAETPEYGAIIHQERDNTAGWTKTPEPQHWLQLWEHPRPGRKYLISVDVMTGEDEIYGTGEGSDRHSVLVWRAAYTDEKGAYWKTKLIGRIKPPCQENNTPLCRKIWLMSRYFGDCIVVVEANKGVTVIKTLRDKHNVNLYMREQYDSTTQRMVKKLGWHTDEESRRVLVDAIQDAIRDQTIEIPCPHFLSEAKTFVRNAKGKAEAAGSCHDDDILSGGIGINAMMFATTYHEPIVELPDAPDELEWR